MLTSGFAPRLSAERTMVDGLIELEDRLFDVRSQRAIHISKHRGSKLLGGKHSFQIDEGGITVFPRIEAMYSDARPTGYDAASVSTGIPSLDAVIMGGGFPKQSATVVVGSTGTGKTTLGLHFLAQSTPAEPGLLFGFFESPERLRTSAKAFGIDLANLEASGAVTLLWHSQGEHILDELGHRLLQVVAEKRVRRLVIDGLSGFFESATYPERIGRFFACLTNELRRRGVTLFTTLETRDVVGSVVPTPYGISAIIDNVLFLRLAEDAGQVHRVISLIKVRNSSFDAGLRTLHISPAGMRLGSRYTSGGDVIPSAEPIAHKGSADGGGASKDDPGTKAG
jgi:circadian clock protein KaiC